MWHLKLYREEQFLMEVGTEFHIAGELYSWRRADRSHSHYSKLIDLPINMHGCSDICSMINVLHYLLVWWVCCPVAKRSRKNCTMSTELSLHKAKRLKLKPVILIYRDETWPAVLYNHRKWRLISKSQCTIQMQKYHLATRLWKLQCKKYWITVVRWSISDLLQDGVSVLVCPRNEELDNSVFIVTYHTFILTKVKYSAQCQVIYYTGKLDHRVHSQHSAMPSNYKIWLGAHHIREN